MGDRAPQTMTIEAFVSWQSGRDERYELIGGEPVAMAGAKLRHDRVTGNAFSEIRRQMRSGGNPCDAFTADIGIRTPAGNIRRPDVSVLCPPFDEEATTSDSPRLIVEVLSESTERVDRLIKLDEYRAIESLDYILVVDPTRIDTGFWLRDAGRTWHSTPFRDLDAVIEMPGLGISLRLASLYERVAVEPHRRFRLVQDDDSPAPPA
jgi:Uma2 family endonuclease